jgi:hypothetical protein
LMKEAGMIAVTSNPLRVLECALKTKVLDPGLVDRAAKGALQFKLRDVAKVLSAQTLDSWVGLLVVSRIDLIHPT